MNDKQLIERLRHCASCDDCAGCQDFDKESCIEDLMNTAADRISDLLTELRDERHRHDRYVDFELAEAEELRKLKEQLRWIPVTERLPDSNKSVLVRCTNTTISGGYVTHIGSCDSGKFWFLRTQPGTASFPVREWQVTHWMPLPEPPKEV